MVDVGPPVRTAHHVRFLVTVVFACGQPRVKPAGLPTNFVYIISTVNFSSFAIILIDLSITSANGINVFGTKVGALQRSESGVC